MCSEANVIVDQVNLIQSTVSSYIADLDQVNLVRKTFYSYRVTPKNGPRVFRIIRMGARFFLGSPCINSKLR